MTRPFLAAVLFLACIATSAQAYDESDCSDAVSADTRIEACTNLIAEGVAGGQLELEDVVIAYNNRGASYSDKGDFDRAIADLDEAIRLDPDYVNAHYNRGLVYLRKGDFDRAMADLDETIRLNPDYAGAHYNRGVTYRNKGDFDRAVADFDEAIRVAPQDVFAHLNRGLAYFRLGSLPKAQRDMETTVELVPDDAYAVLWRDIIERRNNLPSRLSDSVAALDMGAWPAPIVRLYLGELTPAAALAAAADDRDKICEALFYIGQLALLAAATAEARQLLELAKDSCPTDFIEYGEALAELRFLDSGR